MVKHHVKVKKKRGQFLAACEKKCCSLCKQQRANFDKTYEIFPKGVKAALTSSVVISGLKSPTKTWK
jgi:hypothetical protein